MAENILNRFENIYDEEPEIDTSVKVKVGIIGTGWIAEEHARCYKAMPDVELVAAADLVPGKAEKFCKTNKLEGVRCYESGHAMLEAEDLDAVSICTYNCQHAPCAIDALEHGVHVMLEKHFTVTVDEAVEVMRAERKSGKILTIGFQPRMSVNMKRIKQIVDSGELGKVYYIQSGGGRRVGIPTPYGTTFIDKETGGIGAMGDIGCYSLDMLLNAVGYPRPLTVTGYTSDFFGKDPNYYPGHPEYADVFGVDDFAAGFVRLEGGIMLDFRGHAHGHHGRRHHPGHKGRPEDSFHRVLERGLRQAPEDLQDHRRQAHLHRDSPGSQRRPVPREAPLLRDSGEDRRRSHHTLQPDYLQPGHHRRHRQVQCCRA